MHETETDIDDMRRLLERSAAAANPHLTDIISERRRLSARQVTTALTGMRVLVVATVTRTGDPRTSCVDGHFLRGHWIFTTSATAAKARDLASRPAVSCTYVDGERMAVFVHGHAERVLPPSDDFVGVLSGGGRCRRTVEPCTADVRSV